MRPFAYTRARDNASALQAIRQSPEARFIAGGTNLVDLMKVDVMQPDRLVDINRLDMAKIEQTPDGLRLGALARNADTANHALVRKSYPLLTEAILAGASPQLRNAATNGGNLLQRTRCYYFYEQGMPCNKREPGSGCAAMDGYNRIHAILGASDQCIAVHPSDMCVALAALGAVVEIQSPKGMRSVPIREFHRLPGDTPHVDANLAHEDLIVSILLPSDAAAFAAHSHYMKIRDRASYAFALVSVAAALDIQAGVIREARLCLGGVAHKPWTSPAAEKLLAGAAPGAAAYRAAADAALEGAKARQYNGFKIELARNAIVRSFEIAAGGAA